MDRSNGCLPFIIAIVIIYAIMYGTSHTAANNYSSFGTQKNTPEQSSPSKSTDTQNSTKNPTISPRTVDTLPQYEDARWPTRNPELLAIPEEERYYNAWNNQWSYCTVAGPVVEVYQAKNERGMPIFIDIGEEYPSADGVTLLVWADQYDQFAEMINDVDDGGAWLSVTGYLSVYNGRLQFDAGEEYVEYTWWTRN